MNQPSNLPPGVTDRMIEEQTDDNIELIENVQSTLQAMNNVIHELYRRVATSCDLPSRHDLQTLRADVDSLEGMIYVEG